MITERRKRPQECDNQSLNVDYSSTTHKKSNKQFAKRLNFYNENSSNCKCDWLSAMHDRFVRNFYTLDKKAAYRQYSMLNSNLQTIESAKERKEVIFTLYLIEL